MYSVLLSVPQTHVTGILSFIVGHCVSILSMISGLLNFVRLHKLPVVSLQEIPFADMFVS